jgi:hypothetical protein
MPITRKPLRQTIGAPLSIAPFPADSPGDVSRTNEPGGGFKIPQGPSLGNDVRLGNADTGEITRNPPSLDPFAPVSPTRVVEPDGGFKLPPQPFDSPGTPRMIEIGDGGTGFDPFGPTTGQEFLPDHLRNPGSTRGFPGPTPFDTTPSFDGPQRIGEPGGGFRPAPTPFDSPGTPRMIEIGDGGTGFRPPPGTPGGFKVPPGFPADLPSRQDPFVGFPPGFRPEDIIDRAPGFDGPRRVTGGPHVPGSVTPPPRVPPIQSAPVPDAPAPGGGFQLSPGGGAGRDSRDPKIVDVGRTPGGPQTQVRSRSGPRDLEQEKGRVDRPGFVTGPTGPRGGAGNLRRPEIPGLGQPGRPGGPPPGRGGPGPSVPVHPVLELQRLRRRQHRHRAVPQRRGMRLARPTRSLSRRRLYLMRRWCRHGLRWGRRDPRRDGPRCSGQQAGSAEAGSECRQRSGL